MVKLTPIRFAELRLLGRLQFADTRTDSGWRFEHSPSVTVFLFRAYKPEDRITQADEVATRIQLDWRGLLSADAFDNSLNKAMTVCLSVDRK